MTPQTPCSASPATHFTPQPVRGRLSAALGRAPVVLFGAALLAAPVVFWAGWLRGR